MVQIQNIQCEHMDRPLAVTVEKPRFSWEWDAEENNVYQSANQIIVQKEDGVLVWDSTRTAGRDTTDIEYAGQPLEPRRRYLYRITAWDQEGREAKSGQEYFETALWKEEDWKASWIEPDPLPQLETVPLKAAEDFWRETVAAMMRGEKAEMTYDEENLRAQPLEPYDPPVRMRRVFHLEKRAVRHIRGNAAELRVQGGRIACCGFSAGAHLVGSLAVHYGDSELLEEPCQEVSNRPDAVLLCYPVITSGEKAHRDSFNLLFGENASEEQLAWASLEKHVTKDTPPAFLWQTLTDELVPVENSILYVKACRAAGVPCELHLFMEGGHGMSLANEDWADNNIGEGSLYTMTQQWQTMKTLHAQNPAALPETFASTAKSETLQVCGAMACTGACVA